MVASLSQRDLAGEARWITQGSYNWRSEASSHSGASAAGAFFLSSRLFPHANGKAVSIAFMLAVICWAGLFIYAGFVGGSAALPLFVILLGAAPALLVAYWAGWGEI
jgi:hypothetical protein